MNASMQTNIIFFVIALLAFATTGTADEELKAKVHAADLVQFHALIEDAYSHPRAPVYRRELIDHALTSRRLDLIADVFSNPNLAIDFRKKAGELESSDYTDKIAIVMLRSPMVTFWPYEGPPINSSQIVESGGPEPMMIKPLTTAFEKLLPGVSRETLKTMIWTKAGRGKLADQLYSAMQDRGVKFTRIEKAILHGGSGSAAPASTSSTDAPANSPAVEHVPTLVPKELPAPQLPPEPANPAQAPADNENPVFWISIIGVVAIGLWVLIRQKA